MRSKRISAKEQLKLIMECRMSGLADYQWCQTHDIRPGTFYNWISRLRKCGAVIPDSSRIVLNDSTCTQEVVKVELAADTEPLAEQTEQNTCNVASLATISHPAVEIIFGDVITSMALESSFPLGAVQMVQNLEGMGFTVVSFGQGFKDMSPPTKKLMKLTLEQRLAHGGYPVLR